MLKTRLITAICMLSVFIIALLFLPEAFFPVLVIVVLLLAAWEWANLSSMNQYWQKFLYCVVFLSLFLMTGLYSNVLFSGVADIESTRTVLLASGVWWAIALLWVQGYPSSAILWGKHWARSLIGLVVLIPSGISLIFLHSQPQGKWLILLLVVVVATADTGAYFSGKAFGKRKLAKAVSPAKSWEGVIGGVCCCALLAFLIVSTTKLDNSWLLLAVILPTALVSVLGDLLESMVKRHRGIKDSGRILPGHGGVMDRIDGLTAAAPIFALAVILSGWQLPQ